MFFQEILEEILSKNESLRIVKEEESYCVVADLEHDKMVYLYPNEEEGKVIITREECGFPDIVRNKIELSFEELDSFLEKLPINLANFYHNKTSCPNIDKVEPDDLTLLGVFIQPLSLIEETNDGDRQNSHLCYHLLVRNYKNQKFFISSYESEGVCEDNPAVYGNTFTEPADNIDMANAVLTPKKEVHLSVAIDGYDNIYIGIGNSKKEANSFETMLLESSYNGGDKHSPGGYVNVDITKDSILELLDYHSDVEDKMLSLNPIDLDKYESLRSQYYFKEYEVEVNV